MNPNNSFKGIPAFTVLLLMAAIAVLGIIAIPTLNVSYAPETSEQEISVSYSWAGASERIMEAEVTAVLEGALSGMRNCTSVTSTSSSGQGVISLVFRKDTDMAAARFELASRIRNIYSNLPQGVTYPSISLGIRGTGGGSDLTYLFKSPLPVREIQHYLSDNVVIPLSSMAGVENVMISGGTPYEMEILFDADAIGVMGISPESVAAAVSDYLRIENPGLVNTGDGTMAVKLTGAPDADLASVPVANVDGRIIRLGDMASVTYKESMPDSYYRLNGLNTLTLRAEVTSGSNLLRVAGEIRSKMNELQKAFPTEITAVLSHDSSEAVSKDLEKILFRTVLCVLILLVFVFLVYRSLKYMLLIATILGVNILVAIVFYRVTGLGIHIYTLAGITVSLGIIIDSTIVMSDHYSYYRDRSVFMALLGATATTIGALCVILLLPDEDKKNLADFSKVIIINLSVSLLTAYFFIPSLLEKIRFSRRSELSGIRKRRMIVRFNKAYASYISFGLRHKWLAFVLMILLIGLPVYLLPESVTDRIPNGLKKAIGSTSGMFARSLEDGDFYREPQPLLLQINAGMPEGCTVSQLNDVIKKMENYLSGCDGIESFTTSIVSPDNAQITVAFTPEAERDSQPVMIKSAVIDMANLFGGANWTVSGVNDHVFSNFVFSNYKQFQIRVRGYNYDELLAYAEALQSQLASNQRVTNIDFVHGWSELAGNEFNLSYDFASLAARGISPYHYFTALESHLFDANIGSVIVDGYLTPLVLRSSDADKFDLWHLRNTGIAVDSVKVKLGEVGTIVKRRSALPIQRINQSYQIIMGYDFIGPSELGKKQLKELLKSFNEELPVGYKAEVFGSRAGTSKSTYIWLIFLIIAIIYVMCAMIFESLRFPFAVILLIPLSMVGVFLTFGTSEFTFDQGGFAAIVMLCGLVVNAGIYLTSEYLTRMRGKKAEMTRDGQIRTYIRSFNQKINPILLTVLSTVLGLIPFLFDGPTEVFWFAFAIGTMGGLLFSLAALVFYMPLFCFRSSSKKMVSKVSPGLS